MSGDDDGFVEFYVSSNPPLTPAGVQDVTNGMMQELGIGPDPALIELLYEPEVPWFRLITKNSNRLEVTQRLDKFIIDIGGEEVAAVDADDEEDERSRNQRGKRVDVDIVEEGNPRMIPWVTHEDQTLFNAGMFPARFPDTVAPLRYKAIWRAYEQTGFENMNQFLDKAMEVFGISDDNPWILDDLGGHLGCVLTSNLQQTVLYLGKNQDMPIVTKALETLNELAKSDVSDCFLVMSRRLADPFLFRSQSLPARRPASPRERRPPGRRREENMSRRGWTMSKRQGRETASKNQ